MCFFLNMKKIFFEKVFFGFRNSWEKWRTFFLQKKHGLSCDCYCTVYCEKKRDEEKGESSHGVKGVEGDQCGIADGMGIFDVFDVESGERLERRLDSTRSRVDDGIGVFLRY